MLSRLLRIFASLGFIKADFIASWKDRFPKGQPEAKRELVIVGDQEIQKWACMTCPGGCGERIALSLNPNRRPRWKVTLDKVRRPTITPSVHQTNSCGCHFWVKKGKIEWCKDGKPRRRG
ncbi:DUF6527 family protein [Hyphomonas sp.]|uniref:DUF6527 family protein n=1 Tax=Hyphomonas sp. TaxID=87 RepID=UPI0025C528B4|nr:DUF6527 family protein [Hyphomonas sp.]